MSKDPDRTSSRSAARYGSWSRSSEVRAPQDLDAAVTLLSGECLSYVYGPRTLGKSTFLTTNYDAFLGSAIWQEAGERRAVQETNLRRLEGATDELNASQRGWLARSIRAWLPHRVKATPKFAFVRAAGTRRDSDIGRNDLNTLLHHTTNAADLGAYLVTSKRQEQQGPYRNRRSREHHIPEWLRGWLPEAIPVLIWGVDPLEVADIVAPPDIPPTVWSIATTRLRELAELLARLADTIFPNAPTTARPPKPLFLSSAGWR